MLYQWEETLNNVKPQADKLVSLNWRLENKDTFPSLATQWEKMLNVNSNQYQGTVKLHGWRSSFKLHSLKPVKLQRNAGWTFVGYVARAFEEMGKLSKSLQRYMAKQTIPKLKPQMETPFFWKRYGVLIKIDWDTHETPGTMLKVWEPHHPIEMPD